MRIRNERDGSVVADRVEVARSLVQRLIGLMGRRDFSGGTALVIPSCSQVHTFFVRFPIDVVFLDAKSRILCVESDVRPYGITRYCKGAVSAVELPAGTADRCGLRTGDILAIG